MSTKILTYLKRHTSESSRSCPAVAVSDLRILLHRRKNFLMEELPQTLDQLFLRAMFLPSKKTQNCHYRWKATTGAPAVIKHCRQPLIGVRNSVSVPIISNNERFKALFISRFSPEVTAEDFEKSHKWQFSLRYLVCTKLESKFNTYASFRVSANLI
jgi:hypothetical protein